MEITTTISTIENPRWLLRSRGQQSSFILGSITLKPSNRPSNRRRTLAFAGY
jgi:hypothetical protein